MNKYFIGLLFLICVPATMHAMDGDGNGDDVVGLDDLTDITVEVPAGETVPQQLQQIIEAEQSRLKEQFGEDAYNEAFQQFGSKIAKLQPTRGGAHADLSAIVAQLATGNQLMASSLSEHRRERAEDVERQNKVNFRGIVLDCLNGAAAITAAALSIASLVKVVTELG